jgi:hypothetical protein
MNNYTKSEKIAKEILLNFGIELNNKNIEFVTNKIECYRGGRKSKKIVSYDIYGNPKAVFFSIKEMAKIEGLKYKSAVNIILTGGLCRKTNLIYKTLYDDTTL